MKASKSLASAVAAAVVGLVYAQTPATTTPPAMPADSSGQTMQNQGTGSMQTPAATDTTAGVKAERPAQADRN